MGESMQHHKSRPLFRALGLLWSRMGPAQIYVLAGATALLVLASLGLVHLLSSGTRDIQGPATIAPGPTDAAPDREALIAITEIGSSETKGRRGQKNVAVKIAVAPRPNLRKGEVEIRVAFFDLTETDEMRPTEAEVNYEWLTPIRDWTDPTPKYLVATYEGAGPSRKSLRYGGFVVRVYFEGQLQAERSEPRGLLAALRSKATPSASRAAWANGPAQNAAARVPATPSSPVQVNRESSPAAPYASPVPDKSGFVYSPHNSKFLIDVRGFPPGTEVNDPNTGKPLKVP